MPRSSRTELVQRYTNTHSFYINIVASHFLLSKILISENILIIATLSLTCGCVVMNHNVLLNIVRYESLYILTTTSTWLIIVYFRFQMRASMDIRCWRGWDGRRARGLVLNCMAILNTFQSVRRPPCKVRFSRKKKI